MSAVVAVVLAVAIPQQVEQHLINGEIRSLTRIAGELADQGMIPPRADDPKAMAALDEAVRGSLVGSDIVRVKIWLSDGTIAYSDEPGLIGKSFPLSDSVKEVFNGRPHVEFVDVSNPENVYERGLPPLREFYIPVLGSAPATASMRSRSSTRTNARTKRRDASPSVTGSSQGLPRSRTAKGFLAVTAKC
jgi:hypothetical protein